MAELERIKPINRYCLTPRAMEDIGPAPALEWLPLEALVVDHSYQRRISERSITVIRGAVERFDWAAVKALSVIDLGNGTYEVIDGQHTAIAAATHGGIKCLPALICAARSRREKANAFVQVNTSRVAMTPLQIFWAQVEAGDAEAEAVVAGADKANARILRYPPANGCFREGDTMSIAALRKIARRKGKAGVARVLRLGVQCKLAPIGVTFVRAVEEIIWAKGGAATHPTDPEIYDVVRGRWKIIERRADIMRCDEGVPKYRAASRIILTDWEARNG